MNWYEAVVEARLHGISRAELAESLGVDADMLEQWERDEQPVQPEQKVAIEKAMRRLEEGQQEASL